MSGRDVIGYLQRQVRELAKKRAYCKNTVAGKQRGKKYQAAFRAEVVMAMLGSNSICAVAKKYGVDNAEFFACMAEAFLDDEDAVPDKLAVYYDCIVEH